MRIRSHKVRRKGTFMEFVAGLIIGVLAGMFSWLALAAWFEAQRTWLGKPDSHDGPASSRGLDRLHEQQSHA